MSVCSQSLVGVLLAVTWFLSPAIGQTADPPARPSDATALLDVARTHYQRGRYEEALDSYDELAAAGEHPVEAAVGQSRCHESLGEWPDALKLLQTATKQHPDSVPLLTRLAEVEWAHGLWDDSERHLAAAVKRDPGWPATRLLQANQDAARGRLKQADEGYRWFVRLYNDRQPTDAETLLLVARGAGEYARWHHVSQIFDFIVNTVCRDALRADPDCWQAHAISGMLLLEKYNRADGLPMLQRALAINPRAAEVHAAIAAAALDQHNLEQMNQSLERALEINPAELAALLVRADSQLGSDDRPRLLETLEVARKINPRDERVLARLAAACVLIDGPPAVESWDRIWQNTATPDEAGLVKPDRCTKTIIEVVRRNPHPGVFLTQFGLALERRWKFDWAERALRQALQSMPQLAEPKTELALLYMRTGKTAKAGELFDEAFDADPYHVRVSNMRKVWKLLDGFESVTSDHFVIRAGTPADIILAQYMADYLEQQYAGLTEQFGYEPLTRTQFELYGAAHGRSAHEWFSARMTGIPWVQTIGASTGMIVALTSPSDMKKPYNWARVTKHEFVHILTLQMTRFQIPHWFTEALAVSNEGYPRPEQWDELLVERVPRGELKTLDTLNQGFIRPKDGDDWQMAYCQSYLYAQFIIEKFGSGKIGEMLVAYRDNLSTAEVVQRVFQIPQAEFEARYLEYVRHLVQQIQAERPEPVTPLAEAEKAHLADPKNPVSASRYAWALELARQTKTAERVARQVLDQDPRQPLAALVIARHELRARDLSAAVKILERAYDREHPQPRVLEMLAELKFQQQDYSTAAEFYETGLKQRPAHVAWLKGLARCQTELKRMKPLKATLQKIVGRDPDDAVARQQLTKLVFDEQNFDETIRYGMQALQVDVLAPEVHRMLAISYGKQKQWPASIREWSVLVTLKPEDGEPRRELARAQLASGDRQAAIETLQKWIEQSPDDAKARQLLEELR